jgi:phosphatidylserine decarboxylase
MLRRSSDDVQLMFSRCSAARRAHQFVKMTIPPPKRHEGMNLYIASADNNRTEVKKEQLNKLAASNEKQTSR